MEENVSRSQIRLLEYAQQRLGSAVLARRLKTDEENIAAWMSGGATIPNTKLLALADLIDEIDKPT